MIKNCYVNTLKYTVKTDNKGAPYFIDGFTKGKNKGNMCESIAKNYRGLFVSDSNPATRFDEDSDIPEFCMSVKSSGFSLARKLQGKTAHELIADFFARVHSSAFCYMIWDQNTEEVIEYIMTKSEFGAFINEFSYLHYESNKTHDLKINALNTSKRMIEWFEKRL